MRKRGSKKGHRRNEGKKEGRKKKGRKERNEGGEKYKLQGEVGCVAKLRPRGK